MKPFTRSLPFGLLLLFVILAALPATAQTHTPRYEKMSNRANAYYEYLPEGYSSSTTTTYPLLLFVTGIGEFGDGSPSQLPYVLKNGVPKLIQAGTFPKSFVVGGVTHRFIVITPQFIKSPRPTADDIEAVLDFIVAKYRVNTRRIYITGLSYGGGVAWAYPGNNPWYAKRIAATVPVAGAYPDGGDSTIYARSRMIAANNVPVWAFHNLNDPSTPVATTNTYISNINQSPAPTPLARKTIFNASGHDAWTKAYDPGYKENNLNMYQWMLQYQRPTTKTVQVNVYGGSYAFNSKGWNNWSVGTTAATNKTSTAFKYATGATSTISAVISDTRAIGDNGSTYRSGMAPAPVLRHTSYSTITRTLTLRGLSTSKTYNLELYASRSSSTAGSTVFKIGTVSRTINAVNNFISKASFTNVTPNSSGQIVVTISKTATYNYLNGFTLTENSSTTATTLQAATTGAVASAAVGVQSAQPVIGLFPNPARDNVWLTLRNGYGGTVQVQLADAAGRVQQTARFVKDGPVLRQSLPVGDLPPGLYFITVGMVGVRHTIPLTKQ